MAKTEFVGVIFDSITDTIIERCATIRVTYAEAMADAKVLVAAFNSWAEEVDDALDGNTTIGRVSDDDCYVLIDGRIAYSEAEAA